MKILIVLVISAFLVIGVAISSVGSQLDTGKAPQVQVAAVKSGNTGV